VINSSLHYDARSENHQNIKYIWAPVIFTGPPPPPPRGLVGVEYRCSFTGEKRLEVMLNTDLYLVSRLRMSGAIPLLPLYALMAWTRTTSQFVHGHFKTKSLYLLYCAELSFAWHEEVIIYFYQMPFQRESTPYLYGTKRDIQTAVFSLWTVWLSGCCHCMCMFCGAKFA
jgi:hypothetical protein